MRNILAMVGVASLLALGALQGCGDDDDDNGAAGSAGSAAGTAGAGAGTAGAGAGTAGTAGTAGGGGTAGSSGETLYCGKKESELAPLTSCDDANASACAKAMCGVPTDKKDCKQILIDCVGDEGCNKSVACGGVCRDPNNPDKNPDGVVEICSPLAGNTGLGKALAYKGCADALTACGGDGSLD